jgi:hypothetical protein
MKNKITKIRLVLIIALAQFLISSSIFAQAPQKMSYQAVIRNSNDSLLVSTPVGMRISLVQGTPTGTVVFSETQTATTNANGLVSLQIGTGTAVSGTFAGIDWAAGPYYVKTETDLSGGTNYTIISSNEILSVPYALFSANGTPGPSAYQVAVANGFIGTETQWLESLQGTNGTNGETGATGPAGTFPPGTVAGEMNYWNGTEWVTVAPGISLPGNQVQTLGFCNGVPTWGPCPVVLPTVTTTGVFSITNFSASSGGAVTSDGGAVLSAWGVCWSTSANPTLANSFLQNTVSSGSFSSALSGLTQNTTYYVRAYATNSAGTAYGDEQSFTTTNTTTDVVLPTITTLAVSAITTTSASSGGAVTSDGGAALSAWGVCWSTSANPILANSFLQNNGSAGFFNSALSGLTPNTTYYLRAYATNSAGTAYGNEQSFTTTDTNAVLPTITTTAVSAITTSSASSGATITSDGGATLSAWGVCWSTSANPTLANSFLQHNVSTTIFGSALSDLTQNTTYYVRAYATNSAGTAYGNELSFTTLTIVLPIVTTTAITSITSTSANSGGTLTYDGGATVSAWGVCWSTSANPTLANSFSQNTVSSGSFSSALSGLTLNTTYYVRAFATNSAGTAYGNEQIFTTTNNLFAIGQSYQGGIIAYIDSSGIHGLIAAPSDQGTGIRWGCYGTEISGADGTAIGTGNQNTIDIMTGCNEAGIPARLCGDLVLGGYSDWYLPSKDELNQLYLNRVAIGGFINTYPYYWSSTEFGSNDVWSQNFQDGFQFNWHKNHEFKVRAVRAFTTTNIVLPTITTTAVSAITSFSASSGATITSDGNAPVTSWGVCWSTSTNPTIANNLVQNNGGLSGLTPNTTYYVRSYATNSAGTAYGNEQSFTTSTIVLPTITTTAVSAITTNSASSGATINSDGGVALSAWGVCWSTSSNPTLANSFLQHNVSTTIFGSTLSGLTQNTTYYVRAYATNSAGTAYGNEQSFTTLTIVLPIVTTTAIFAITSTSANSGGTLTSDGGATVSAWGVCWSTSANPTLVNSFSQNTVSSGSFSSALSGLTLNTTYYVRAFATNSAGTAYGNEQIFTTTNNLFAIGQSYQGGIVAYIDSSGIHGLIAAPSDQGYAPWGCYGTEISGADGTAIGTGNQNTIDIMTGCNEAGIAARLCGDLVLGGYSDWYLPSKDEIIQLYINRVAIGGFADNYWSSTEDGSYNAFHFNGSLSLSGYSKANGGNINVRAVRAF